MKAAGATLTEQLVDAALASRRPSAAVRRAAGRLLFDFCACTAAGAPGVPSWPLDRAGRLALAAHLRDRDDLHLRTATHPGGVVWAAVTACALERPATLGEALAAGAFGYELTIRLARAVAPAHARRWHATATAGTVGAAGAAALLLGADRAGAVDAVAHAVSVAGGSVQAIVELSGTRFLHRAHAASAGVECARAACSGLGATRLGLEEERGTFVAGRPDELVAVRPPAVEETHVRLLAASGFAHAAMEAAAALGPLEPSAVRRVEATVSPPAAIAIASNASPADDGEAWWSIQHAVAAALVAGDPDAVPEGTSARADVLELCRRVELAAGGPGWQATVAVTPVDGVVRTSTVESPATATDDDLLRKWHRLVGADGSAFLARLVDGDDDALRSVLADGLAAAPHVAALLA